MVGFCVIRIQELPRSVHVRFSFADRAADNVLEPICCDYGNTGRTDFTNCAIDEGAQACIVEGYARIILDKRCVKSGLRQVLIEGCAVFKLLDP